MNFNTTVSYMSILMVRRLMLENQRLHKRSEQGPLVFGRIPVALALYNRPDVREKGSPLGHAMPTGWSSPKSRLVPLWWSQIRPVQDSSKRISRID